MSLGPGVPDMADKVWLSRPLIGPGPKLGRIASRERISLDLKEMPIKNFPGVPLRSPPVRSSSKETSTSQHEYRVNDKNIKKHCIFLFIQESLDFFHLKVAVCWANFL